MNLVTRPGGGLLSDVLGSRSARWLALLGRPGRRLSWPWPTLGSAWPLPLAIGVSMCCSVFGQAGNGAVYAIVPLVKKRVSGQIAGLVGAYGNVGGIVFLTTCLFVSAQGVLPHHRRRLGRGHGRQPLAGRAGQQLLDRRS